MVWPGSRGKDQILPLLFGSWKTFTNIYQEVVPKCKAWILDVPVLGSLWKEQRKCPRCSHQNRQDIMFPTGG